MSIVQGYANCPNIQESIDILWDENGNELTMGTEYLQVLKADANTTAVISNEINRGDGKLRAVEMTYAQRHLISDVENDGRITCSPGAEQGELTTVYDIDPSKGSRWSFRIDPAKLIRACRADSLYLAREIARGVSVMTRAINEKSIIETVALKGNIARDVINGGAAGTTQYFDTKTKNTTSGAILYDLIEDVALLTMQNEVFGNAPTVILGGENYYRYGKAIEAACCGDIGVNVADMFASNPYAFLNVNKMGTYAGATNRGIAMKVGSVQLLSYNRFDGEDNLAVMNDEKLVLGTIFHPDQVRFPGLKFDYYAEFKCVGNDQFWDFQLALAHDTVALPTDLFRVGDDLEGVNGIFGLNINN